MLRFLTLFFTALVFSSCSTPSSKQFADVSSGVPSFKPRQIYVMDFDTDNGEFNIDNLQKDSSALDTFKRDSSRLLAENTADAITSHLVHSVRVKDDKGLPSSGWLVKGRFLRVGRSTQAGKKDAPVSTKMETLVYVYDLSKPSSTPFLIFETTRGNMVNEVPPAGLVLSGPTAQWSSLQDLRYDMEETAQTIRRYLSEYMYKHGWLSKNSFSEETEAPPQTVDWSTRRHLH